MSSEFETMKYGVQCDDSQGLFAGYPVGLGYIPGNVCATLH